MANEVIEVVSGVVIEEADQILSLAELCQHCCLPAEKLITMIEIGVIDPLEPKELSSRWQFSGESVIRVETVLRLQHDLDVNLSGAALALELLDEIKALRQLVSCLKRGNA